MAKLGPLESQLSSLVHILKSDIHRGGQSSIHLQEWKNLTGDKAIIDIIIHGLKLNFTKIPSLSPSREYPRPSSETLAIDDEGQKLLSISVITPSFHEPGENFSNLFTVGKPDDSRRTTLNIKNLNLSCSTYHFKIDTIHSALKLVSKNCFFTSIDLKDAFFSAPVNKGHHKFLKCIWKGKIQ